MENKFFAATIFLIFGIFMVTSHLNFAIAADSESGDSGVDDKKDSSKDSGDDKKDSGDDDKQQNKEGSDSNDNQDTQLSSSNDDNDKPSDEAITKSTPPTEEEEEKEKAESDVQQQDSPDINDKASDEPTQDEIDKEKAAIEDYIYDEPGKVKPYSTEGVKEPWKIKLIESLNSEAEQKIPKEQSKPALPDDPYEVCDVSDKCRGPGVKVNENGGGSITNCIGYYCFGEEEKDEYEKIIKSGKCDGINDSPKDKDDCLNNGGRGGPWNGPTPTCNENHKSTDCVSGPHNCKDNKWSKDKCDDREHNNWCKYHKCHENHNHRHNHNNDKHHYDKVTKNYYYYYTNDYSNNHATVILQPDYSQTNNYHDIRVVIGDDYAFVTIINFAGKPENLVITGLDINEGEQFEVCMKNENDGKTNCVTATLKDEDKAVYVDIRVP